MSGLAEAPGRVEVRPAHAEDLDGICAIWNPIIRDTAVTFNPDEKSVDDLAAFVAALRAADREAFVARVEDRVAGFALYVQFRGGRGYARTMEHTIHVADGFRGRGIGRALMTQVEGHAAGRGAHSMIAGVSGENPAGRAFHAAMGYAEIAVLPEVGWKFGRWIDLHLMRKVL